MGNTRQNIGGRNECMLSGHFTSGEKAKDGKIVWVAVVDVGKEAECGWSEWSCGGTLRAICPEEKFHCSTKEL